MHRFLITRSVPGASRLSAEERLELSAKSSEVVAELAPSARWLNSWLVDDKIYCLFDATDADTLREHARRTGLPLDTLELVHAEMAPLTHA